MPLLSCFLPGPVPLPLAPPHRRHHQDYADLSVVRALVESTSSAKKPAGLCPAPSSPIHSLHRGDWVKLICGANFEDAADVRNLSLVYALAGVDCIDCAVDASVVNAVVEGVEMAMSIAPVRWPWLMISSMRMLQHDPAKRISAKKATEHPYFDDLDKTCL